MLVVLLFVFKVVKAQITQHWYIFIITTFNVYILSQLTFLSLLGMSEMKDDDLSGVPDWSTVHKPVGDLFKHVVLVCIAVVICCYYHLTHFH